MTYCLGIKVASGLVALADTRLTSGTEVTTNKKLSTYQFERYSMFIMTSGLRSVRDKAVTYFQEVVENSHDDFDKMFKAVNAFGDQVKRVAREDKEALLAAGLRFDLYAIVGGQLKNDSEHKLFLLYPEGNWVEVGQSSPFLIIGNTNFGKPLLYRSLKHDTSLAEALKIGFLSFDSTRVSVNDVDYPLDVLMYEANSYHMTEHRFAKDDLEPLSLQWDLLLNHSVQRLPNDWMNPLLDKVQVG